MRHGGVLLDECGRPGEGRLLIPDLARRIIPKRLLTIDEFADIYPPMAGGANTFPYEGLDYQLNGVPMATRGTNPSTLYLGLFNNLTSTTVPSDDAKLTGGTGAPWTSGTTPPTEVSGGSYARVSMANTVWGSPTTQASVGRRTTATQQSFPQSTASWGTVNGFFLATASSSTAQNTGVALYYANFSDGLTVNINGAGYVLQLTPYFELDSSQ